ncbi:putative oxido C1F5.03c [Cyphellophora attinorum]|uniref:Putative oxido C1F5.03c n=1 Tax=Cyphellophora attinorum TaxID=1664694 RepID=A0A0N0NP58_9EURO|nr:putative oxido C1F5.03c [Phialophora attinorum]KPI42338.1 putative oxido C1F5.03c [Phialophora attinorum]
MATSTTTNGSHSAEKKEIVIIGGGIIGATTAYFLTRHPAYSPSTHSITILEATGIASGASGKAGGLLALWAYPSSLVPLSFKLHKELAKEHDGANRWGYRALGVGQIECVGRKIGDSNVEGKGEEVKGVHDVNVGGGATGDGNVSLQKRSKDSYKRLQKMGLPDDLDWVSADAARGYEAMGSEKDTAQVHPYQFTTAMVELAKEKGAKVIIGRCTALDTTSKTVTYTSSSPGQPDTETRTIEATDIILTTGAWTPTILPSVPIGHTRAHSVVITPSRPVSAYALFTSISLPRDYKQNHKSRPMHVTPEIYARPFNSVYACGEGDHLVPLPATTADVEVDDSRCQDVIDYVSTISDELRDGKVEARQACYLPIVESGGGPLVGPTGHDGVWLAAGHTCWGIQNGPGTGKIMSEFVMDGKVTSAKNIGGLDPRRVL